jgi:hypothetical protein
MWRTHFNGDLPWLLTSPIVDSGILSVIFPNLNIIQSISLPACSYYIFIIQYSPFFHPVKCFLYILSVLLVKFLSLLFNEIMMIFTSSPSVYCQLTCEVIWFDENTVCWSFLRPIRVFICFEIITLPIFCSFLPVFLFPSYYVLLL